MENDCHKFSSHLRWKLSSVLSQIYLCSFISSISTETALASETKNYTSSNNDSICFKYRKTFWILLLSLIVWVQIEDTWLLCKMFFCFKNLDSLYLFDFCCILRLILTFFTFLVLSFLKYTWNSNKELK